MWLHCPAAVRPCCCAPCLTRAYVKNVGRHLLRWSRSGPEGMETVCVCEGSGYLAMPTVTSHTSKLVLLSPFTAHYVLFTVRSVILWEATIGISSEVKFGGLSYPSESLGNSRTVCLVKPIPSCNSICFYFRYLPVKRQHTIAVRLWPLVCGPRTTETILWDWLFFFVPAFFSWTAPALCGFQSGLSKAEWR